MYGSDDSSEILPRTPYLAGEKVSIMLSEPFRACPEIPTGIAVYSEFRASPCERCTPFSFNISNDTCNPGARGGGRLSFRVLSSILVFFYGVSGWALE